MSICYNDDNLFIDMINLFYVYYLMDPFINLPFYVGKGGGITKKNQMRAYSKQNRSLLK